MDKKAFKVGEPYRPYFDRFRSHPYAIPVTTFLVLFFLSIAVFIGLNAQPVQPSDSHIIKLTLDSQTQSVPTRAQTVREFVERADLKLAPHDIVEPDLDTPIVGEAFKVNVYRARPVTIDDGGNLTSADSAATTPRSVAQQAGLTVYPEDEVKFELPESVLEEGVLGEKVVIDRATPVHLNLYGVPLEIRTHTKTVGDLLKDKSVQLEPSDTVQPALESALTPGVQVFVLRSGLQVTSAQEDIAMPVEIIEDPSLSFGSQAVRQKGSPGKKTVTYEIKLENGREVSRRKIQEVITQAPVKQVMARGPQGSFGQALTLLRSCEGAYSSNTGNGYYGAYQFNATTWQSNAPPGYENVLPHQAPPDIQDQAATNLYKRRGWQPWPTCSIKLGLKDSTGKLKYMTYQFDGYNWLLRFEKGELLVQRLTELVKQEQVKGAWVSGVGGALWAELGFYDLGTRQYRWKKLDQPLEITSLQGSVAWEGDQPALHLHGSFSDTTMQAYGGHVRELAVAGTCEVLLHRWYQPQGLKRTTDPATGLKLLDL